MQEADMGATQVAMNAGSGARNGDEHLLVRFVLHPKRDRKASKEAGRDIYKEIPYVEILQPGNKDSRIFDPATDYYRRRFPQHWDAFQKRQQQDMAIEGTLLETWPGCSRAQVEELRYLNIRTVEQLASLSDANAQGIMGINSLREKAKAFLEASEKQSISDELAELRKQNEALQAQMAEMQAKPKRGRPAKADTKKQAEEPEAPAA